MAVYVDQIREHKNVSGRAKRYGNRWCHMMADVIEELYEMADLIGLSRKHIQNYPSVSRFDKETIPHFDLTPSKRRMAVDLGAREMVTTEIILYLRSNENR